MNHGGAERSPSLLPPAIQRQMFSLGEPGLWSYRVIASRLFKGKVLHWRLARHRNPRKIGCRPDCPRHTDESDSPAPRCSRHRTSCPRGCPSRISNSALSSLIACPTLFNSGGTYPAPSDATKPDYAEVQGNEQIAFWSKILGPVAMSSGGVAVQAENLPKGRHGVRPARAVARRRRGNFRDSSHSYHAL